MLAPNGTVLDKPWHSQNDSRTWNQMSFDLSRWRGRTFQIYFNVYNDGQGGTAGMFLDDVSLVACSNGTPAATSAVTPNADPNADARRPGLDSDIHAALRHAHHWADRRHADRDALLCHTDHRPDRGYPYSGDCYKDPDAGCDGFALSRDAVAGELCGCGAQRRASIMAWPAGIPPSNVLPVRIVGSPVLSPPYALLLGTQSQQAKSYSSVRQYLTLPAGTRATLQFSTWTWSEPAAGADRQEAILLGPDNSVQAVLWRRPGERARLAPGGGGFDPVQRPADRHLFQCRERWRGRPHRDVPG